MAAPVIVVTGTGGAGKTTVGRLVAQAFDPSVHLRIDDFTTSVVNGWIEPGTAASAHQDLVVGGAVAVAALTFAEGGYTVVLDGHVFPEGLAGLAEACRQRGVPLHYAVLAVDLETSRARVAERQAGAGGVAVDPDALTRLHARWTRLGRHEANTIDASGAPEDVAAAVLAGLAAGRLAEVADRPPAPSRGGEDGGRLPEPRPARRRAP